MCVVEAPYNFLLFHVQPEDGHCQVPKHVVVPYVVNTRYTSTPSNKVVLDKYIHSTLVSLLNTMGMTNLMRTAEAIL